MTSSKKSGAACTSRGKNSRQNLRSWPNRASAVQSSAKPYRACRLQASSKPGTASAGWNVPEVYRLHDGGYRPTLARIDQPLTAPMVNPLTTYFWKIIVRTIAGAMMATAAAITPPQSTSA